MNVALLLEPEKLGGNIPLVMIKERSIEDDEERLVNGQKKMSFE